MMMRSLEAHGVPSIVLDTWERSCGTELLPVQERAVAAGVLRGQSLLVCSPTSSGKTFVGEMASIHAALNGRRVLYLVPTKALAEAKFREFNARYAPLGLRIAIATRDRRAQEREIGRGEFDLLIAVPEKVRALLADRPTLARDIGAVVADELQMLGDPERGPCLELLLGDLVAESADAQIVGLSAVLGQAEQIARWLGAELLRNTRRPLELRKGVLAGGEYHYRQHNDGCEGVEHWLELAHGSGDLGERLAQVAARLAEHDGPTLVFVRDKRSAVRVAMEIAGRASLPAAREAIAELGRLEATRATELLAELAARGVGFHTADLQFDEREVVEAAFSRGELRALVCTSTLALGVNLPARNVIVDAQRWHCAGASARPTLGPISRADFENMAGRAGRFGVGEQFGRAILLADGEVQRHVLLAGYVDGEFDRLEPPLRRLSPLRQVCLLAGSTAAASPEGMAEAWGRTLAAREHGLPAGVVPSELREALDLAAAEGLVREEMGGWQPTPLGRLAGTSGLSPRSFLGLLSAARACDGETPGELETLLVAALTDEAQSVSLATPGWVDAVDASAPGDDPWELEELLEAAARIATDQAPSRRRERAVRIVLALQQWRGPHATGDIEQSTRTPAGRLRELAEATGWAVEVLGRIGRELGWSREAWQGTVRLGETVAAGVPVEGLALRELHVPGLGRGHIRELLDAGIAGKADLARAGARALGDLLGPTLATRALAVACGLAPNQPTSARRIAAQRVPPAGVATRGPAEGAVLLVVDGARPDRVLLGDAPVELRPAEFRLLQVLATSPGSCVGYEEIYQGMWGDECFVEPAQIYSHRSRLARKLGAVLPGAADLLRTIPKRGLMLDLPPERVALR